MLGQATVGKDRSMQPRPLNHCYGVLYLVAILLYNGWRHFVVGLAMKNLIVAVSVVYHVFVSTVRAHYFFLIEQRAEFDFAAHFLVHTDVVLTVSPAYL
jgi:hypothetical protein